MKEREQLSKELAKDEEIIQKSDILWTSLPGRLPMEYLPVLMEKLVKRMNSLQKCLDTVHLNLPAASIVDFVALNSYTEIMNYIELGI